MATSSNGNWRTEETRRIAEAGYIFGLPIVMNYAIMYEYAVGPFVGTIQGPV
jgi:hypothetical protein